MKIVDFARKYYLLVPKAEHGAASKPRSASAGVAKRNQFVLIISCLLLPISGLLGLQSGAWPAPTWNRMLHSCFSFVGVALVLVTQTCVSCYSIAPRIPPGLSETMPYFIAFSAHGGNNRNNEELGNWEMEKLRIW